jgi:hypothetical protein
MNITHIGNSRAEGGWIVVSDNRKEVVAALKYNVLMGDGACDGAGRREGRECCANVNNLT